MATDVTFLHPPLRTAPAKRILLRSSVSSKDACDGDGVTGGERPWWLDVCACAGAVSVATAVAMPWLFAVDDDDVGGVASEDRTREEDDREEGRDEEEEDEGMRMGSAVVEGGDDDSSIVSSGSRRAGALRL